MREPSSCYPLVKSVQAGDNLARATAVSHRYDIRNLSRAQAAARVGYM